MPDLLLRKKLFLTILFFVLLPVDFVLAQKANLEILQELALECLERVPDSSMQFILNSPPSPSFIQSELVNQWQEAGYTLFVLDSLTKAGTSGKPTLSYSIENSSISYERRKKKRVQRDIEQTIHFTFIDSEGTLLKDAMCTKQFSDTVSKSDLNGLESEAFPQTQAPHPQGSWLKRYIEPAVLATATALGVYLFFTLRSDTNDDGN